VTDSTEGIYFAGSVKHIVDRLRNTTMTTTIYAGKITYYINGTATTAEASDVMKNGSFKYSRTDVNEAGTVTAVGYDAFSNTRREVYVHPLRPKHRALDTDGMQSISNGGEGFRRPYVLMGRRPTIRFCQRHYGVPYRDRWSILLPDRRGTAITSSRAAGLWRPTRPELLLRIGNVPSRHRRRVLVAVPRHAARCTSQRVQLQTAKSSCGACWYRHAGYFSTANHHRLH
jgi:hypothetical protein